MKITTFVYCLAASIVSAALVWGGERDQKYVHVMAKNKYQRSAAANAGMSLEFFASDSVWGFANDATIAKMRKAGLQVVAEQPIEVARGGSHGFNEFPAKDARFHDYQETMRALEALHNNNRDMTKVISIGKSREGRDIWALQINSNPADLASGQSQKAGMIYMGNHHAREHLSAEVPIMFAEYLLKNKDSAEVGALVRNRDIWIVPMVNPDGVEFDIAKGRYQMWRKNRTRNNDGTYGVDLNRNYGFKWGTGGSSKDGSSDTYMGPAPFSEPETQAVRDFVKARKNARVLVSFHTFSELILYPWGNTYDPIMNARDLKVFETMAKQMATWNKYKPQQSSDLYIASGDTTDWAYGELGIFAFTFELSPKTMLLGGGFYPGAKAIDKVFAANLKPCLYMLEVAENPYGVIEKRPTGFLKNLFEPSPASEWMSLLH